jgi:hypothetical protein
MAMATWARDRLYLAVLVGQGPTDDEWNRWIALGGLRAGLDKRVLVEARGGGPSAKQRKEIIATDQAIDVRIAIMTESTFVRGIVTALTWFGISLRAFPLHSHELAAKYLELSADELQIALEVLPRLRAEASTSDKRAL